MAIKIIKPAQKEFYAVCEICGCEFTYEWEDLKLSAAFNKVPCPTCGKDYYHTSQNKNNLKYIDWPPAGDPIPCIYDFCTDCDWAKKLQSGETYVGDIPCNWCSRNPNGIRDVLDSSCSISSDNILLKQ